MAVVVAPLVGGITAAVLYDRVVGRATALTMTDADPQAQVGAGNRSLATPTRHHSRLTSQHAVAAGQYATSSDPANCLA